MEDERKRCKIDVNLEQEKPECSENPTLKSLFDKEDAYDDSESFQLLRSKPPPPQFVTISPQELSLGTLVSEAEHHVADLGVRLTDGLVENTGINDAIDGEDLAEDTIGGAHGSGIPHCCGIM